MLLKAGFLDDEMTLSRAKIVPISDSDQDEKCKAQPSRVLTK